MKKFLLVLKKIIKNLVFKDFLLKNKSFSLSIFLKILYNGLGPWDMPLKKLFLMDPLMKEIWINLIKLKVLVFSNFKMDLIMKDIGSIIKLMDKENFILLKDLFMKDNGKMINPMAWEKWYSQMEVFMRVVSYKG